MINRLPVLVAERMAETPTSTFDDWRRLIVDTVRKTKDSQRTLNYIASAQAEAMQYAAPAPFVMDAKEFIHT